MERIASRQWHRLRLSIGRSAIRIPSGAAVGRTISSSSSSSLAAAARRRDAEAVAVEQAAEEARPAGMSAKAWGKQRQRSEAVEVVEIPSPYPQGSASHKTLLADIEALVRSAAARDGEESAPAHSAQSWLQVLSAPSASYALSAPYLLSTGAFYQPPLQGPGGRALLARLHSHLMASQIHSVSDAELALKVLNRHCVLGTAQAHSMSAWPPIASQASTSGSNFINAANQDQLISTYSRNVDLTLNTVSVTLERILRDLGATHLVLDCAKLVVQLAVRFRAQVQPASSSQMSSRRSRHWTVMRKQKGAHRKAKDFRQLFLRLAHLLPHRSDQRNVLAATQLLKSVVVLCNIHLKLSVLKDETLWPSYQLTASGRLAELAASNLPRKRARQRGLFDVELCRDVARALMDAPTEEEVKTSKPFLEPWCAHTGWLPVPLTRPVHTITLDNHGEQVPSGPLGLRSGKRRSFLTIPLARACIYAIYASTAQRKRRWDDMLGEMELGPGDYDAALRAVIFNKPADMHGPSHDGLVRGFGSAARRTEVRAQAWRKRALTKVQGRLWKKRRYESWCRSNEARRRALRAVGMLQLRCRRSFRYTEDTPFSSLPLSLLHARKMVWDHSSDFFKAFRAPWSDFDSSRPAASQEESSGSYFPKVKASKMEFWRELVSLLASDPDVSENEVLGILGTGSAPEVLKGKGKAGQWRVWAEHLRRDAATYETAIAGFSARSRWEASDAVWHAALRRRSSIEGSFDRIVRAYIRSKRTSCGQAPLYRRKRLMERALDEISKNLLIPSRASPTSRLPVEKETSTGPSVNLAKGLLFYVGRVLGYPETSFSFWEMIFARYPQTATSAKPLSVMLQMAEDAERRRHVDNSDGLIGGQLLGPSLDSLDAVDTPAFKARQLFRRLLFDQHPTLAPWASDTATQPQIDGLQPVDTISIFRTLPLSSRRLAGTAHNFQKEDLAAKSMERAKILTLSLSALSSADAMQSRAFSSGTSRVGPVAGAMDYINFDHRVFEAYCSLLHTMTVPNSDVGRLGPSRPTPMPQGESRTLNASSASSWAAAFIGPPDDAERSHSGQGLTPPDESGCGHHLDVAAFSPPKWDEVVLVLPWMRALNVRPTHSMLCLICVHLLETLPPGSIGFDKPMGPIQPWLESWLGWRALPREEDIAVWLREQRRLNRAMEASKM
ncbi:hypothetical protein A4X09_0g1034 [Tilletia walkeri]|uniref:Uncharacterized protein n=1 Tax=Tilletia walkeri TaxID=117179 RepID=A0A8X7T7E5_9BASI|nr:hypothetical protein A4X09_0g1034 [Tilletia walkeri]